MTDVTVRALVARWAPFGALHEDGRCMGAWHVVRLSSDGDGAAMGQVEVAVRTTRGHARAWRRPCRHGDLPPEPVGAGRTMPAVYRATPFHAVTRKMDEVGRWGIGALASEALARDVAFEAGLKARAVRDDVAAHLEALAAAMREFVDTLDPDALEWADLGRVPALVTGSWEGLDSTFRPGAPLRAALVARPAFSATLRRAWQEDPDAFHATMGREGPDAVVRSALARSLPRPLLARLGRMADEAGATRWPVLRTREDDRGTSAHDRWIRDDLLGLAAPLADLPADRLPADGAWGDYLAASSLVGAVRARVGAGGLDPALGTRGNDWRGWWSRLAAAAGRDPLQAWEDSSDRHFAFAGQVVDPALAIAGDGGTWRDTPAFAGWMLDSSRTVARWLEEDARWHARAPAIDAALAALPGAERVDPPWAPVMPDFALGDLSLHVLVTGAQLVEEGRRDRGLDHCVGGYGGRCRDGDLRVASIRRTLADGGWERLSTVAFDMTAALSLRDGVTDVVVQHRGAANAEPPPEASSLLEAYVAWVAREPDLVAASDLAAVHAEHATCGYDPRVPGNWERALAAWTACVPRRLRGLTPSRLLDLHLGWVRAGSPSWSPVAPSDRHRLDTGIFLYQTPRETAGPVPGHHNPRRGETARNEPIDKPPRRAPPHTPPKAEGLWKPDCNVTTNRSAKRDRRRYANHSSSGIQGPRPLAGCRGGAPHITTGPPLADGPIVGE